MTERAKPLKGLRVLDLTTWWAGPLATMILADLGAEVIKIEAIQRMDNWRAPLADLSEQSWWETSPLFNAVQRNKFGLTLNLTDPKGVSLFKQLVAKSDFVFENFSRRVMPQFGLTYDVLCEINPRLIMVSQTGFGQDGPWADYISFANVAESLAGIAHLTGNADGPPCISGQMLGDSLSGVHGACAALLALQELRHTGVGQHIDLSQLEVNLPPVAEALADQQMNQRTWKRDGNRHPHMSPHGCYPAEGENRWLVIAVTSDEQWVKLVELWKKDKLHTTATERADHWASDKTLRDLAGRKSNEDRIDLELADWTRQWPRDELVTLLRKTGIPVAPVLGPSEILTEPHLKAREYFKLVDRAHVGVQPYPGSPIRFSKSRFDIERPAPKLGEHNEEVLKSILGLSDTEIKQLEQDRVIGTVPIASA